jgi:DnaK suppressor protein
MSNTAPRPAARSLTSAQRAKLRVRLEHELGEVLVLESQLRGQAADALESRRGSGTDESEDPEGSSLAFEGAQVNSMLKQTATHASEIAAAIERIDAGTYGICRECHQPIAFGRLEARPSAAYCIDCAS